jgi:plastocyanin
MRQWIRSHLTYANVAATLMLVASLAPMACGGGGSSDATAPTTTASAGGGGGRGGATSALKIEADAAKLAYTQDHLSTQQGSVTIDFKNPSSTSHNVTIENSDGSPVGSTDTISNGTTSTKVSLVPGTYTFFCSVDGHEAAGMKGTLSVKERRA